MEQARTKVYGKVIKKRERFCGGQIELSKMRSLVHNPSLGSYAGGNRSSMTYQAARYDLLFAADYLLSDGTLS